MLAGEAVVAIWNGIAAAGRETFYGWHIQEHMPERVGIPGFRRGRRYIAADGETHPEFFTLYEADTMQVLQGSDYANRLNAPTPWTKAATAHFTDTSRALARVRTSLGPGCGGALLTIRFADADLDALRTMLAEAAARPRVCGAHLCVADADASAVRTAESRDRTDILASPPAFVMIEATGADALRNQLDEAALARAGVTQPRRGVYVLEYTRGKTAWT
ncbi:MAG TPA: hypothetical protein VHS58_11635 [Acetobacteraceae bacterium]|jgi:hypothetical protein|nr:hypothetical protein [Acetobacteraceae bacterium]